MTKWIVENVKPRNGRYDQKAFDVAFQVLHADKFYSDMKIETAKKAVAPLLKTKAGGQDAGLKTTTKETSPDDEEDEKFIALASQLG